MTGIAPVTAESAAASANTHLLGGDEFPLRYDLRDYGVVTPVRYQEFFPQIPNSKNDIFCKTG